MVSRIYREKLIVSIGLAGRSIREGKVYLEFALCDPLTHLFVRFLVSVGVVKDDESVPIVDLSASADCLERREEDES